MLLAYRAAAQALTASLLGTKIDDVRVTGITFFFPERISRRTELLIDLAITLAGVAAVSSYGFGRHGPDDVVVTWSFGKVERSDFRDAHAIVSELAPLGDDDVFFQAWQQAMEFVSDPTNWHVIERLVPHIIRSPLRLDEIEELIDAHFDIAAAEK